MFYGYRIPFSDATLSELYTDHDDYVERVEQSIMHLQAEGWLTPRDGEAILREARESSIP